MEKEDFQIHEVLRGKFVLFARRTEFVKTGFLWWKKITPTTLWHPLDDNGESVFFNGNKTKYYTSLEMATQKVYEFIENENFEPKEHEIK